jgi:hypothetical protein
MDPWEWTPAGAFWMGVGVAALGAVLIAIFIKAALAAQHAQSPNAGTVAPVGPRPLLTNPQDLRLRGIEERLSVIEGLLQRQVAESRASQVGSTG